MVTDGDRYEVAFTLDPAVEFGSRETFRWTWARITAEGLVAVRGDFHQTLRTAIDSAARYRRSHGGGEICVNIHGTRRADAPGVIHTSGATKP